GPVGLISPHQTGLVEASDGFGHPRDGLARAREHVAREHVADDERDVVLADPVVVHVGLEALQDEPSVPVHCGDGLGPPELGLGGSDAHQAPPRAASSSLSVAPDRTAAISLSARSSWSSAWPARDRMRASCCAGDGRSVGFMSAGLLPQSGASVRPWSAFPALAGAVLV